MSTSKRRIIEDDDNESEAELELEGKTSTPAHTPTKSRNTDAPSTPTAEDLAKKAQLLVNLKKQKVASEKTLIIAGKKKKCEVCEFDHRNPALHECKFERCPINRCAKEKKYEGLCITYHGYRTCLNKSCNAILHETYYEDNSLPTQNEVVGLSFKNVTDSLRTRLNKLSADNECVSVDSEQTTEEDESLDLSEPGLTRKQTQNVAQQSPSKKPFLPSPTSLPMAHGPSTSLQPMVIHYTTTVIPQDTTVASNAPEIKNSTQKDNASSETFETPLHYMCKIIVKNPKTTYRMRMDKIERCFSVLSFKGMDNDRELATILCNFLLRDKNQEWYEMDHFSAMKLLSFFAVEELNRSRMSLSTTVDASTPKQEKTQ
jgi:hypothetical protein